MPGTAQVGVERRERLLTSYVAGLAYLLVRAGQQLALLPAFLLAWGAERYEQWILLSAAAAFIALADLGTRLGYAVELGAAGKIDPVAGDAAVVVASHGQDEERVLAAALREGVPYVGLVASEVRGEAVRDSLDLPDEQRAQLHTPAGLEIGAETPEEIALAILAEIVALRRAGEDGAVGEPVAAAVAGRGDPAVKVPLPAAMPASGSTEVALDPVCGMEVAVSEASIQLELSGERYYFCSEGCRDSFASERAADAGVR